MVTSTYIQIQYRNIGYEIVSAKIRGVVCAYDPTRTAPFPVIAICDNRDDYILSKVNTDHIRRILTEDIALPEIKDVLFVILNKWRSRDLVGGNHVVVECGTGKYHVGRISADLKHEYRILTQILAVQKRTEEKNRMQKPYLLHEYPVRATYLMMAALFFLYTVTGGRAEEFGVSYEAVMGGEYARLITYMFTHGGLLHLLGNMSALWVAGRLVEKRNGAASFLLVYVLSGIAAALVSISFNGDPSQITVGASGAVCGLLGALFTSEAFTDRYQRRIPLTTIAFAILVSLTGGARYMNTDNLCHIGGLVFGMLVMGILCLCRMIVWDLGSIKRQRFFNRRIVFSGFGENPYSLDRTG